MALFIYIYVCICIYLCGARDTGLVIFRGKICGPVNCEKSACPINCSVNRT